MVKLLFHWLWLLRMLRHPNVELVYIVVLLGPFKSGIVMELADDNLCSYCKIERGMGTRNNQSLMNTREQLCCHRFARSSSDTSCPPKSRNSDRLFLKNTGMNIYSLQMKATSLLHIIVDWPSNFRWCELPWFLPTRYQLPVKLCSKHQTMKSCQCIFVHSLMNVWKCH